MTAPSLVPSSPQCADGSGCRYYLPTIDRCAIDVIAERGPLGYGDVAALLGVTPQEVRSIEKNALAKLQAHSTTRRLAIDYGIDTPPRGEPWDRERIAAALYADPQVTDAALIASSGRGQRLVRQVRRSLGIPKSRRRAGAKGVAVRAQLAADPSAPDIIIAERAGASRTLVGRTRKSLGLPPSPRRTPSSCKAARRARLRKAA